MSDLAAAEAAVPGMELLPNVRSPKKKPGSVKSGRSARSNKKTVGKGAPKVERSGPVKKCGFACGKCQTDADDQQEMQALRWAYSDGSGNACWWCERVWHSEFAHKHKDRKALQSRLGKDLQLLDTFQESSTNFVDLRSKGKKYIAHKRGLGVKKLKLKQTSGDLAK